MADTQGKGRGDGANEKHTSRADEQGPSGSKSGGQKGDDKVVKSAQQQTRAEIDRALRK